MRTGNQSLLLSPVESAAAAVAFAVPPESLIREYPAVDP
jgi:hypothetical protein